MQTRKAVSIAAAIFIMSASLAPSADAAAYEELAPMGCTIGIEMSTDGVIISQVCEVETESGNTAPARDAGMLPGDIIKKCNGAEITCGNDFSEAIREMDGSAVSMELTRGVTAVTVSVTPAMSVSGKYEMGLRLRDGMAGIGTVTFFDPDTGFFGALGHAINDIDSGIVMPLREGSVMRSTITDVKTGRAGAPGQLVGSFADDAVIGTLYENGECGIFGYIENGAISDDVKVIPIVEKAEIKTGPAVIRSNVSGMEVREYDVEITRLYSGNPSDGRSMMLKVTDPELISATGGIVQGMSGSPIIQNGHLVGAVTHVLVDDPTKGFGISISDMLNAA